MIEKQENKKKILLSTGGTGGHIFPTIVISKILTENNYEVLIVSDEQLNKYLNEIEYAYKIIQTGKTKAFKSMLLISKAIIQNYTLFKKFKPDLVIGFGSYATFPTLIISKFLKIPLFLHESNSIIGAVNRWFSGYANTILINFPELYGINISNAEKLKVVGMPVRNEILELANLEYNYPDFDKNEKFNILITAGSGGANFFSNQLLEVFEKLDKTMKKRLHIIHQARVEDLEKVKEFYVKNNISNEVKIFFNNIYEKYKVANLVICRSGTGTISEISTIGLPTIFIPSPNVLNDHQTKNVLIFEKENACILQKEVDFEIEKFYTILYDLVLNKNDILFTLKNNIKKLSNLNSNNNFLQQINNYFKNTD